MPKYIFIIIFSLVSIQICTSETFSKEKEKIELDYIEILPNWGDDSVINLELIKSRYTNKGGVDNHTSSKSNVELKFSKTNSGWNCIWKPSNIKIPKMNNKIEMKIQEFLNGFKYDLTLDTLGGLVDLNNWKEIQESGSKVMDALFQDFDPEIKEKIKKTVSEMFNTKEKIETYMMQEVQLFFSLSGLYLEKNDTLRMPTTFINPLTNKEMTQIYEIIYLEAYSDSTCDIRINQYFDASEFKEEIGNTVENFVDTDKSEEYYKEINKIEFDIKVVNDFNISFRTGQVQKAVAEKKIKAGENIRIDKIELTIIK